MEVILFSKYLGLNDSRTFATQTMVTNPRNPAAGSAELIDCLNLTVTAEGCLEKIPGFVSALVHTAPILGVSARKRLLFQDGVDTQEWTTGVTVVNRFPITDGPMAHTAIDCRVSGSTKVYKSVNPAVAMAEAVLGNISDIPVTNKTFAPMPAFDHAFVYNAKLYAINHEDPRFIQYSEDYHYDVCNLADNFIAHSLPVLQAGAVPGAMVALHATGVTVYVGSQPSDFEHKFYPLPVIAGTLYSGFINKVHEYGHVFLCADGVYLVSPDGSVLNLTLETTRELGALNTSYTCAAMEGGKYLAFGNTLCVEFDFKTKTALKRSSFGVKGAASWKGATYYAVGSSLVTMGTVIDTGAAFVASMTLPFSDWGAAGTKSIDALYFTGTIGGVTVFTLTDNVGKVWTLTVSGVGRVSGYRIKAPLGLLGNHISVKISVESGSFRIEALKANIRSTNRSR